MDSLILTDAQESAAWSAAVARGRAAALAHDATRTETMRFQCRLAARQLDAMRERESLCPSCRHEVYGSESSPVAIDESGEWFQGATDAIRHAQRNIDSTTK